MIATPTFTQTFLPRTFGSNGDLLGIPQVWTGIISTSKFTTNKVGDYYIQAENLYYSTSTSKAVDNTMTADTIIFPSPVDFAGEMRFAFSTYQSGIFRDTLIETGKGKVDFFVTEYKYDVKFAKVSNKWTATILNFACLFNIEKYPTFEGTVKTQTKDLFNDLRVPIEKSLNTSYCPLVKAKLQTVLSNFLVTAQTSQSLNWSYGGKTLKKTLTLTSLDEKPFENGKLVIIGNGTLTGPQEHEEQPRSLSSSELSLESDFSLKAQSDDICVVLSKDLVTNLITANGDFFKQYSVLINSASGGQKYYPFNLFQYWEATQYDQLLYDKIGNELGKYKQTDPVVVKCDFKALTGSLVTNEGYIQATVKYGCSLELTDSNNAGAKVNLYQFEFDFLSVSQFTLTGAYLNTNIMNADIMNVGGITLNTPDILNDLRDRFKIPFVAQANANVRLLGAAGIKMDYVTGRQVISSLVGDDLQVCFR